jgi:hypothetical protein
MPIKVGVPRNVSLRSGPNVVWDEAEQGYRARISGRIKFRESLIDVEEDYSIKGDVGPETGNIRHPGSVVISGDVISEFKVEAEGTVDVKGQVYAAEIHCGGDLVVRNGINGSTEKTLEVKGSVKAKHVSSTKIMCSTDVCVDAEICNSQLNVRGEVVCRGRIVGGSTVSLKGIRAGQVGSEKDIRTILVTGVDFELAAAFKSKKEELEELIKVLEKVESAHIQLERLGDKLIGNQREQRTKLKSLLKETKEKISSLEVEKGEIHRKMLEGRKAKIVIDKVIYPGTILRIVDSTIEIQEMKRGPLMASFDTETGFVTIGSPK